MIQLDQVYKGYGGDDILEEISFIIGKKEKCALVGRNGAGKTTLFRIITGQQAEDKGSIVIARGYRLGYLSQHMLFTKQTVIEEATSDLTPEESYKAESYLFGLGYTEVDLEKHPNELSGGYQLRLHLTKLLLTDPDCLLLDEPTNYLDILSIRWLTKFLQNWPKELVMISHDRQFLDAIATHTIGIHRKKCKKIEGPSAKYYAQLAADEEIYEKTRQAVEKKRDHLQSFVDRFGAKNTKATQAQSKMKAIKRLPALDALCQIQDLSFSFAHKETPSKVILKAKELSFSYDHCPLIQNFNFELAKDARLAIIGQNGRGKSTLLKLLAGILKPSSGSLWQISDLSIGYFGQTNIDSLDKERTIIEEIHFANPELSLQTLRSIAGQMMFTQARSEKKIAVLSGGEKARVVLAKILATKNHLLLLDEPTNHLDVESMESFMDAVDDFPGAVIMVTHSELVLERTMSELIVFQNGMHSHFMGDYEQFVEKGGWQTGDQVASKRENSYKDQKRQRAEWVTERSKVIKPLQTKADTIEKAIIQAESELERLQEKLIAGFTADLAKQVKELQIKVESLFSEFELVHAEIEKRKAEFERVI
jgi:ATP-binding cassette subfamily F protein 3